MCTKARFTSRALAIQRIVEIQKRGEKREKNPIRAYYCKVCGGYHLTSFVMTGKQKRKILYRKATWTERVGNDWMSRKGWKTDKDAFCKDIFPVKISKLKKKIERNCKRIIHIAMKKPRAIQK